MNKSSLYEELGVERTATKEEIKKAYRSKAAKYHPDVNKAPDAEKKFKRICEAYMILYDDTSRWKYDQTGTEEKPSDRKPINYEEQAKTVLYRIVFASIDKLGSNLNKKNLQGVIIATTENMQNEVQDKLNNNKYLLKAAYEKRDAVIKKQVNVEDNSLLYQILNAKIKYIESQEILPLRETRKTLLTDKKTVRIVLKLAKTQCKDATIDQPIDSISQWDNSMAWTGGPL